MDFLRMRPVRSQADLELLQRLAEADGHGLVAPTWMVDKGPQTIGYIGSTPSVLLWLDSQRAKMRDSLEVMNFYENQLAANGAQIISVPCMKESPLYPFMEKVGYRKVMDCGLFMKNLND